jgi:excisionase family DNA binding protein
LKKSCLNSFFSPYASNATIETTVLCIMAFASFGQALEEMSLSKPYLPWVSTMDPLMTIEEVARYMRVSRFTVYRLAKDHRIPATKVGRLWRFHKEEIDRWIRQQHPNIGIGDSKG